MSVRVAFLFLLSSIKPLQEYPNILPERTGASVAADEIVAAIGCAAVGRADRAFVDILTSDLIGG